MKRLNPILQIVCVLGIALFAVDPAGAKGETSSYQTGFVQWRSANNSFAGWNLTGATIFEGALKFSSQGAEPGTDPPGAYNGGNFYNGGSYLVGEALSPVTTTAFPFTEAIVSWNAATPASTWIEIQISAQVGGRWTKWYNLGVWASDDSTIRRHSVNLQGDADGYVAVDTLVLTDKKLAGATAFQLKVRLFSVDGTVTPTVYNLSAAYSTHPDKKAGPVSAGNPSNWDTLLAVPECSQMVYADGGEVWCSPTSTSMVVAYWQMYSGPCEPRVREAVAGVYDWIYDGHGNWPFNTAYAATKTDSNEVPLEGYVARFTSLDEVEEWVKAGVPVVVSFAWSKNDLTGAAVSSSNGHLSVIVGFDATGNPIVNDPAASADADVQRTYLRSEFEPLWLTASGGTVYLIYPEGWEIPE